MGCVTSHLTQTLAHKGLLSSLLSHSGMLQMYKQQQAALMTEGSKQAQMSLGVLPPREVFRR